jgi:hypothetical protein
VFNTDDSLFWFKDGGNNSCFFGLNTSTMQTGFLYAGLGTLNINGAWSQVNPQYYYDFGSTLRLVKFLDTGGSTCHLGDTLACKPAFSTLYNFTANCNVDPSDEFEDAGGVGGSDTVFAVTFSEHEQDTGHQVVAYNSTTNTCYFYSTRTGQIRSYVGTQTPVTGTVTCNGTTTVSSPSGFTFDTSGDWNGLDVRINATGYVIQSVNSGTSATLYTSCPSGTGLSFATEPGTLLGTTSSSDLYSVHNVKIDPSGTWLVVVEGGDCYSSSCYVFHAWEIGTTTVKNCIYQAGGGTDAGRCAAHWTENATGWVNSDSFTANNSPSMLLRTWANFSTTNEADVTELNTGNASLISGFDVHPSNKNDPLGTHGYPILSSTYAPETPAGSINYAYSNEVDGWNQSTGPVYRFGHTFNSSLMPAGCCFSAEYAIGAASSTGQFYIFTMDGEGTLGNSNGTTSCSITGGTCRGDVFILNLSSP